MFALYIAKKYYIWLWYYVMNNKYTVQDDLSLAAIMKLGTYYSQDITHFVRYVLGPPSAASLQTVDAEV